MCLFRSVVVLLLLLLPAILQAGVHAWSPRFGERQRVGVAPVVAPQQRFNEEQRPPSSSSWSPRQFSVKDLLPEFPRFSKNLTDKQNTNPNDRNNGWNPRRQQRTSSGSSGNDWSQQPFEFANPRGLRRFNPGFHSNAYQRAWDHQDYSDGGYWNPRSSNSNRMGQQFYQNYNIGKTISGSSRASFPTDAFAAATEIYVDAPRSAHGRPVQANVEVYNGPNNTPVRFYVYSENGGRTTTPFCAIIGNSGRWTSSGTTVSVRNTGALEFPLEAQVQPTTDRYVVPPSSSRRRRPSFLSSAYQNHPAADYDDDDGSNTEIQGHSLRTWTMDPYALEPFDGKVVVTLTSRGLPVQASVELWGPSNHVLQKIVVDQQDGAQHPVALVLDTTAHLERSVVVAIRNQGSLTFPLLATVQPFVSDNDAPHVDDRRRRRRRRDDDYQRRRDEDYYYSDSSDYYDNRDYQERQGRRTYGSYASNRYSDDMDDNDYYNYNGYNNNNNNSYGRRRGGNGSSATTYNNRPTSMYRRSMHPETSRTW